MVSSVSFPLEDKHRNYFQMARKEKYIYLLDSNLHFVEPRFKMAGLNYIFQKFTLQKILKRGLKAKIYMHSTLADQ